MLNVQGEEERHIREVVERRPLPPHIKSFAIEFGEDWSGDPAVTIALIVENDQALSADMTAVSAFTRKLTDELIALPLTHWPFVQLRKDVAPAKAASA